jgi:hypothetical protein
MLVDCHPFDDVRDFAYRIEVKENAPDLLRGP